MPRVADYGTRRRRLAGALLVGLGSTLATGCALPPEMQSTAGPADSSTEVLPPPGFGTLRQDEVSISLASGPLNLMVTPLSEAVTRMAAPDTYARLSGMAAAHRARRPDGAAHTLFLVQFWTEDADARFVPEEVQLATRGMRVRPSVIEPVTPGWGERRLGQRQAEMAVYGFEEEIDFESDLTLFYGLESSAEWTAVLPRLQAERARARARARGND